MTTTQEHEDLTKCPSCGGEADNGHDRCVPPNVYECSKCTKEPQKGTMEERELLRLASLVGTDAKNPEERLLAYVHHQLQKARQDWLREEIVKLKRTDAEPLLRNRPNIYSNEHGEICKDGFNQALQTIIDRYQAELTQDPVHDFFTAPEEVQRPVYERALQKAQEEQEKITNNQTL